ncbi:MAG: EutN/CcmL family microcompartment protein [Actinobacteria bacterium]|nr:EutN/CcmL family microcompartment protein [Actinomycetota bacterium]
MDFGIIKKELVCTVKDPAIKSVKLYLVQLLKLDRTERKEYMVCAENTLGLGVGDYVLVIKGSPCRQLEGNKEMPIDNAISAKVDSIFIEERYKFLLNQV